MGLLAEPHLWICVENFDPLGGDEQIDLSEGLCVSICILKKHGNRGGGQSIFIYSLWNKLYCGKQFSTADTESLTLNIQQTCMYSLRSCEQNVCLMDRLLCLKVKWKKQKKEAFGSGVSLYQLFWQEDGKMAWNQKSSLTLNPHQLAVTPLKAMQLQHTTSLCTFPSNHLFPTNKIKFYVVSTQIVWCIQNKAAVL